MKLPFYNIFIDFLSEKDSLDQIDRIIGGDTPKTLFFVNAHCFNIAQKNKEYFAALNQADLVLNDGIGISIAGKLTGIKFPDNLNGTDLIPKIIELGYKAGKKFYFLGTKDDTLVKAKENLKNKYPGINIVGMHNGFFDGDESIAIVKDINYLKVDIVIVGMGVPKQEIWIQQNISSVIEVKLIVAGGAILDFLSGNISRAPLWIQKVNMEWVFRLIIEPKRMWKRYLIGNIIFFMHLVRFKFTLSKHIR